jgi:hypothetical protein
MSHWKTKLVLLLLVTSTAAAHGGHMDSIAGFYW